MGATTGVAVAVVAVVWCGDGLCVVEGVAVFFGVGDGDV